MDYSQYTALKLSNSDGIATVTLSNPGRRNAMTPRMHWEMERIWDDLDADDTVRVVVVTGEGDAFCSGADVAGLKNRSESAGPSRPATKGARRIFWSMLDFEKPIISKVRGVAYGLGVNIALAGDIVVAANGTRFCDSHVKAGIAPGDGGAALWPLLVGFHRAKEFIMLGDPVLAERAAEIGLINYAMPDGELDAFVEAMAVKLRDGAPLAISYAKLAVNAMLKQLMAGAFETSLAYDMLTLRTDDHREGATAFVEKRKPKFHGS
jgi:enoyl-CoA hydratase